MGVKKIKKKNGKVVYRNVRSSASRSYSKSKSAVRRNENANVEAVPFSLRQLSDQTGGIHNSQSFITKSKTPKILSPDLKLNLKSSFAGNIREPSYASFNSNGSGANEYQITTSPRRRQMQYEQINEDDD